MTAATAPDADNTTVEYVIMSERHGQRLPIPARIGAPITTLADAQRVLAECHESLLAQIATFTEAVTDPIPEEELPHLAENQAILDDLHATTHAIYERTITITPWNQTEAAQA